MESLEEQACPYFGNPNSPKRCPFLANFNVSWTWCFSLSIRFKEGKWECVQSMSHKRSGAGAAAWDGKLYVCGGTDGGVSLSSGECYNPTKNSWKSIANMISRRYVYWNKCLKCSSCERFLIPKRPFLSFVYWQRHARTGGSWRSFVRHWRKWR